MAVLGVIPARSGSKGVTEKNLRELDGKPLLAHQIQNSLDAAAIDRTILSTDSEEFAAIGREYGAEVPYLRPPDLADDDVPVIAVYKHALERLSRGGEGPEYVVGLQPTSPFTRPTSIDAGVRKIRQTGADSVVSVTEVEPQFHPYRAYTVDGDVLTTFGDVTRDEPLQRQDLPGAYGLTGGIFVRSRQVLSAWDHDSFALGEDVRVVEQEGLETLDIDTPYDLRVARALAQYEDESEGP